MQTEFLCFSVLRVTSGPRVKLVGRCLCYFVFVFSVLLALQLPRLGKRELVLVLFVRLFDLRLFGFMLPLPFGVLEGLRFVIVALPGLLSYPVL